MVPFPIHRFHSEALEAVQLHGPKLLQLGTPKDMGPLGPHTIPIPLR